MIHARWCDLMCTPFLVLSVLQTIYVKTFGCSHNQASFPPHSSLLVTLIFTQASKLVIVLVWNTA
jgi:hypothetical protein